MRRAQVGIAVVDATDHERFLDPNGPVVGGEADACLALGNLAENIEQWGMGKPGFGQ